MRRLLIPLIVVLMATCAAAQTSATDKPDTRLDKKVTLDVSHTKLDDVCTQLTEMTGVTIKAGSGERDWKVRERRVSIEAKDMKLGTLMQEISKLLGFYLSKSGKEGEWAYLYWQDKKSRDLEAEMLNAQKEAAAQRSTAMRQATLDAAEKALKMTPEEIEKAKKTDPLTAYMAGTKSGRGFAQLLSALKTQFPTERNLMLRGKRVTIPFADMPGYLQQAAMDTASGGIVAGEEKKNGKDFPGSLAPYQLVIMPIDQVGEYEAGVLGIAGAIVVNGLGPGGNPNGKMGEFGAGEPMGLFVLGQPDSPVGKLFGEALQAVDDGQDVDEVGKRLDETATSPEFLAQAAAKDSPTEKDPPTDPKLTREIEIKEDIPGLSISRASHIDDGVVKAMTVVSEAIGMPAMLESFPRLIPPGGYIKKGKQPLYKVLIGFEKAGYTWELSDNALRVRPSDWALRRSFEIPESYLARYRSILEKNGEFSLDDLASIAAELTNEQISNTLMAIPEFGQALSISLWSDMGSNGPLLRLYHSLSVQQRSSLTGETGLAFGALTGDQWTALSDMITEKLGGVYVLDGSLRHIPATPDDKADVNSDIFEISVSIADQKDPSLIKIHISRWGRSYMERMKEEARKKTEQAK